MKGRNDLRRRLRAQRRSLDALTRRRHSRALVRRLAAEPLVLGAGRVGLYWPVDGEIDPLPLMLAVARRKRWYLPVLRHHPRRSLWFVLYRHGLPMRNNVYGIPEPRYRNRRIHHAVELDLLLVPLVGFDASCNRLGMGGGFYDHTLAHLSHARHYRRPKLIGVAHECQRVDAIERFPWDVPLDLVITETRRYARNANDAVALR